MEIGELRTIKNGSRPFKVRFLPPLQSCNSITIGVFHIPAAEQKAKAQQKQIAMDGAIRIMSSN